MEYEKTTKFEDGDVIKRELTSRQSWTVKEIDGKLMAVPNTNKFFTETEPVEIEGEYIKIASLRGLNFG